MKLNHNLEENMTLTHKQKKLIEQILKIAQKDQLSSAHSKETIFHFANTLIDLAKYYSIQKKRQIDMTEGLSKFEAINKQANCLKELLLNLTDNQRQSIETQRKLLITNDNGINEEDSPLSIKVSELITILSSVSQSSQSLSTNNYKGRKPHSLEYEIAKKFLMTCHRYKLFSVTVSNSLSENKSSKISYESKAILSLSAVFEAGGDSQIVATRIAKSQLKKLRKGFYFIEDTFENDSSFDNDEQFFVNFKGVEYTSSLTELPNFIP